MTGERRGRIVVGVDESEGAAQALRWAAREAELRGDDVTAVLAWGFLDQHHLVAGDNFDPAYGQEDAAEALDAIVSRVLGGEAATKVGRRAVCELPSHALLDESVGADLLVVGARGMGGFKGLMLGSISQQCLHHTTVPIAVVRGESSESALIVVAIDGSDTSRQALAWALDEARRRGSRVTVVHAWDPPYMASDPYMQVAIDPSVFDEASRRFLTAAVAGADTGGLPAPVEQVSARGGAAGVILDAATGADLIVLGSRGLGGFAGLLLGSVTAQVAHHADTTVVVVPRAS